MIYKNNFLNTNLLLFNCVSDIFRIKLEFLIQISFKAVNQFAIKKINAFVLRLGEPNGSDNNISSYS